MEGYLVVRIVWIYLMTKIKLQYAGIQHLIVLDLAEMAW